jgi:hypothetical protein
MDNRTVYQSLRQELLDTYARQLTLIAFAFTATTAVWGYAINAQRPFLLLLPLIILWLALMQLNNGLYTVFTISVYLREHIESVSEIAKWEQDISSLRSYLRKHWNEPPLSPLRRFNPITSLDTHHYAVAIRVMGFVCILLCWALTAYFFFSTNSALPTEKAPFSPIEAAATTLVSIGAFIEWMYESGKVLGPITFIYNGDFEKILPKAWKSAELEFPYQPQSGLPPTGSTEPIRKVLARSKRPKNKPRRRT